MNGKQLKNSILQWAIQGKLVPQDPNDEPASVLLERIRAEKARLVKEGKIKKDKNESIIFRGEDNSHYEKFPDGRVVGIDDEIPFEVPQSWEWARLGFLFAHNTGKALNGAQRSGTLLPYITTSNLYWDRFELGSIRQMYFNDAEIEKCTVNKGDLLVCEGGDIGRAAIWMSDQHICIQNHIHRLRAYYPLCTRFFYYIFLLYKGIGNIGGKGIGIQGLSSGAIHNILVPIPSAQEQNRIAQAIDHVMPVIEKYEKSQERLDSLNAEITNRVKKSILQEAIQGHLVPQNEIEEPAATLLQRINEEKFRLLKEGKIKKKDIVESTIFKGEDNKYYEKVGGKTLEISEEIPFDLPESWSWCRLASIVHYRIGKTPARGETAYWEPGTSPWVSISDMKDYGTVDHTKEYVSPKATTLLGKISPRGTLLMSFKLTVGRTAVLDIDAYHNEAIISIWPFCDSTSLQPYLFYTLPVLANLGDSKDAIKGKTLNTSSINNLLIPLPPSAEQIRIVNRIKELYRHL